MYPPNSRYYLTPTTQATLPDGRTVVYLRRRFIPAPERLSQVGVHVVQQGDRLDLVAARTFGDPALWWRIADANGANDPDDLTEVPGCRLRITLPQGIPGVADA